MKVLIIQSDGEHKGQDSYCKNDHMRECWAIRHAFHENRIRDVTVWGLRHNNFNQKPDFNSYDLILILEQYEAKWLPDLSKIKKPQKIQWIIDLHCQKPDFYKRISQDCDAILHSTKSLIHDYKKDLADKKHVWFPNGVDDRFFNAGYYGPENGPIPKPDNIIFCGSDLSCRREWIDYAKKHVGLKYMFKTGDDMIEAINSTKIHFNKSISCDVNYRNFETIGLATCLLTNHLPEMDELGFKDGVNCLMYKNKEEIKEKYDYAIDNNAYYSIGMAGFVLSTQHTYKHRIRNLIKDNIIK